MAYNKDEKQTPRRIKAEHKMMAVTEETQSIPQKKKTREIKPQDGTYSVILSSQ